MIFRIVEYTMLTISAMIKAYILKSKEHKIVMTINLIIMLLVLIRVQVFILFKPIRILHNGA